MSFYGWVLRKLWERLGQQAYDDAVNDHWLRWCRAYSAAFVRE